MEMKLRGALLSIPVILRCRREASASKDDGPAPASGPFILRGSLREHLRMTVRDRHAHSLLLVPEQPELRGIARGFGEAEMAEGVGGEKAAARGALQVAALDQIGLNDVLDRIARLRQRRRHG